MKAGVQFEIVQLRNGMSVCVCAVSDRPFWCVWLIAKNLQNTMGRQAEGDPLRKLAAKSARQRVTLCPIKLILSASRGVQRLVVWHPRPSDAAI